ncbi:MAG: hypothetical protein WCT28_01100 [Patescibacteria group bacterium]|jgi:hypothetical protein
MQKREKGGNVLEMSEKGIVKETWDRNSEEYDTEKRGEAALIAALERGRELKRGFVEKAGPLLRGIQSRITNLANRGLSYIAKFIGHSAEAKDTAIEAGGALAEEAKFANRNTLPAFGEMGRRAIKELLSPAEAVRDLLNPVIVSESQKVTLGNIDRERFEINQKLAITKPGKKRDELIATLDDLQKEEDEILHPSQFRRGGVQLAKKSAMMAGAVVAAPVIGVGMLGAAGIRGAAEIGAAGIEVVKEMGGEAADAGGDMILSASDYAAKKITNAAESARNKKYELLTVGAIAREALGKVLGKEMNLSYAQTLSLGASIEALGLAKDFVGNVAGAVGEVLLLEDLKDIARNNHDALKTMYRVIANPERRRLFIERLSEADVEAGAAIEEVARDIGVATLKATKKASGYNMAKKAAETTGRVWSKIQEGISEEEDRKAMREEAAQQEDVAGKEEEWERLSKNVRSAIDGLIKTIEERERHNLEGIQEFEDRHKKNSLSGVASGVEEAALVVVAVEELEVKGGEKLIGAITAENEIATQVAEVAVRADGKVGKAMGKARRSINEIRRGMAMNIVRPETERERNAIAKAMEMLHSIEDGTELPTGATQVKEVA